jgi:hypothetical protein
MLSQGGDNISISHRFILTQGSFVCEALDRFVTVLLPWHAYERISVSFPQSGQAISTLQHSGNREMAPESSCRSHAISYGFGGEGIPLRNST